MGVNLCVDTACSARDQQDHLSGGPFRQLQNLLKKSSCGKILKALLQDKTALDGYFKEILLLLSLQEDIAHYIGACSAHWRRARNLLYLCLSRPPFTHTLNNTVLPVRRA